VRTAASRLAWALLGLGLAFALVEAALAALDVAPTTRAGRREWVDVADARFGFFYVPNARFQYRSAHAPVRTAVALNSRGLRDQEYDYAKAPGVYRILILGDSFTASFEVPLERVWHVVLERLLNEGLGEATRVEIIAAGVQGWSTDQEMLYYRLEGYKYDADLVILQYFNNDMWGNDLELGRLKGTDHRARKPYFVLSGGRLELWNFPFEAPHAGARPEQEGVVSSVRAFLRDHVRTYRFVRELVLARRSRSRNPFCYKYDGVPVELYLFAPTYPAPQARAWELTRRLIGALKADVRARGRKFAVAYFPEVRQVLPEQWEETLECWPAARGKTWDLNKPNRLMGEFLRGEDVPYLDLTVGLTQYVRERGATPFIEKDGHLNPEGHEAVARLFSEWLVNVGLVPTRPSP